MRNYPGTEESLRDWRVCLHVTEILFLISAVLEYKGDLDFANEDQLKELAQPVTVALAPLG